MELKWWARPGQHTRLHQAGWFAAGALGALGMYFADPVSGGYRRGMLRDRLFASWRGAWRSVRGAGQSVGANAYGMSQHVQHLKPEDWSVPNDATLTQRVETELFRDPQVPKGRISINAEAGIVVLRGELDSAELIRSIAETVEHIAGVRDVHNLLHVTGTPAPDPGSVIQSARTE
jgi:BON domain-containing protein